VTVPPNVTATLSLRDVRGELRESGRPLGQTPGAREHFRFGEGVVVALDSGSYSFVWPR
jgi:hypothetical protein